MAAMSWCPVRSDLYNGLSELLGPDRAEVLMAQLPRFDPAEVATRSNFAVLRSDFGELRSDTRSGIAELRGELRGGLAAVNQRLERLFLAWLVGTFGVVASFIGVILRVT